MQKRAKLLLAIAMTVIFVAIVSLSFQWLLPVASPTMRFVGTRSTATGKELVFEITNPSSGWWNYAGRPGLSTPFGVVVVDGKKTERFPTIIGHPGYPLERIDLAPRSTVQWSLPLPAAPFDRIHIVAACYRGSVREFRFLQLLRPNIGRPLRFFDGRQRIPLRCVVDQNALQEHPSL